MHNCIWLLYGGEYKRMMIYIHVRICVMTTRQWIPKSPSFRNSICLLHTYDHEPIEALNSPHPEECIMIQFELWAELINSLEVRQRLNPRRPNQYSWTKKINRKHQLHEYPICNIRVKQKKAKQKQNRFLLICVK